MRHGWLETVLALFLASTTAWSAAAPDWLEDPASSKWLTCGGAAAVAESAGLALGDAGKEGQAQPGTFGGQPGARSLRADGAAGYFYVKTTEPWDAFAAWLGPDRDIVLVLRYFDGAAGSVTVSYDSSDARVKNDPYPPGVWRRPDDWPKGLTLTGAGTWKTAQVRLPFACLSKRLHGSDLRLDPSTPAFALGGVALTRVAKGANPALLVRQELRVQSAEGLVSYGAGACFAGTFAQHADEPLAMEAELATRLTLQEGHGLGVAPDASGGYAHYIDSAAWEFTLKTPGRYTVWQRAAFPWGGNWNHTECMDGAGGVWVQDWNGQPPAGWVWVKAGTYELTAGPHAFSLSYHGGARLDVVVLSRDAAQAPDLAALHSSYAGPRTGRVTTVPVQPFDVARWGAVRLDVPGGGAGTVTVEVSRDAGASWQPFAPAAGLADRTARGGGGDSLQFRLSFAGAEGAAPPFFAGGLVTYEAGSANTRVIENSRLRLELDAYGLKQLFDKRSGLPLSAAAPAHAALATLLLKKPGPAAAFSEDLYAGVLDDVGMDTADPERPVLRLPYRLASGLRATVVVRLLPEGESEWRLEIANPTPFEVAEIRFPVLTGVRLGESAADDWVFLAKCWGQVWQNPAAGGPVRTHWGPSMRWSALWDERAGLYLGIEDDRLDDCAFALGADGSGGVTLAPHQRILVPPGGQWTSAVYRLAATTPDWHAAADLYRRYVARALQPPQPPPYLTWLVDAWTTQNSNAASTAGWDMIEPTPGVLLMAANRQMTDGADAAYCGLYPYPAPAWGSLREFSQKLGVRRALGGLYTPYHNFHLWAPGYGHYPRIGTFPKTRLPKDVPVPDNAWYAAAATYSYDGSYARLETDPFAQLDMAMGSRAWRDWLRDWTARYLDYGADGMYYDQFNMVYANGRLYPDYPDTYGCWTRATLDTIRRMREDGRRANPCYTSSGEVCNDVYGQYLDLHMTSGVFNRLEFYRYCNPEQLLIDGGWNGGLAAAFGGQERMRFIWQVGARFEGAPQDARLLELRRAVKSLLYAARFMDTVGLNVRGPDGRPLAPEYTTSHAQNAPVRGVIGRWFLYTRGPARGAVVNFINAVSGDAPDKPATPLRGARATLDTTAFGPVVAAWAWSLDGRVLPVAGTQKDNTYTFPVPEAECSSVVLSGGLAPVVQWEGPAAVTGGAAARFTVRLTNVNAEPLAGVARLRLPAKWRVPDPVAFGPVAPGGTLEFAVPFTVPEKAVLGRHDLWCELRSPPGYEFDAYALATVSPPVVGDFRGSPGSYHVWLRNLSDDALGGKLACAVPAGLKVIGPSEFALPPQAEIRLPVEVRGQEALRAIAEMTATVKVGRQRLELVRAVIPAIPNGDFESDAAGDGKPDWWMCRKKGDEWSYERLHLADGAHGGRACLRLDPPQAGEEFVCAYPVHSVLAPNTRYRVSVWIRSASATGVYANTSAGRLGDGKTGPEWREFSGEFTSGPGGGSFSRLLYNASAEPAFFDDLTVEEVR